MINAVIFDWGGVLAPADTPIAAQKLSEKYGLDVNNLKEKIAKYEKECSNSKDYSSFLKKMYDEFKVSQEDLIQALVDIPVSKGLITARKLKGKAKLCILSNQMQFKSDFIRKNNDLSFFDHIFFSSEIGIQKPSPKAFKLVLEEINEVAQDCLFIDDKEENIRTAQDLGMKTIHCFNEAQLHIGLRSLGFNIS